MNVFWSNAEFYAIVFRLFIADVCVNILNMSLKYGAGDALR